MKSERGITLMSLIIYVAAMVITIGILSMMTTYFYNNVTTIGKTIDSSKEYTKFNSYFSQEVNTKGIKVLKCENDNEDNSVIVASDSNNQEMNGNYILFSNGEQYTFVKEDKAVYKNNAKIAEGITSMTFGNSIENGKEKITITYTLDKKTNEETRTYILV